MKFSNDLKALKSQTVANQIGTIFIERSSINFKILQSSPQGEAGFEVKLLTWKRQYDQR